MQLSDVVILTGLVSNSPTCTLVLNARIPIPNHRPATNGGDMLQQSAYVMNGRKSL